MILCALGALVFHLMIRKEKFNNKSGVVNEYTFIRKIE